MILLYNILQVDSENSESECNNEYESVNNLDDLPIFDNEGNNVTEFWNTLQVGLYID